MQGLRIIKKLIRAQTNRPFPSFLVPVSKRVPVQNLLYETEFDIKNGPLGGTHFHMNVFALGLVFTQK